MAKPSGEYVGEIWAENQSGNIHKEIFWQGRTLKQDRNMEKFSKCQSSVGVLK